jgi:anti-sigma factor RsiW
MNAEQIEQLRRRMGEVASLLHDDPDRQAVLRQISRIDGPLQREWIDLVQQDERLRLDLGRVTPPPGLQERLLAIQQQHRPRKAWFFRGSRWMAALAASLVLIAGIWATLAIRQHQQAQTLQTIATLTIASHEGRPELSVVSSDWSAIEASLKNNVPFPVELPRLDPNLKLTGGKVMTLAGNKAIYTCWQSGGRTYSLYQFCGKDFGVHFAIPRQTIKPKIASASPCRVIMWTEDHCDYALVIENNAGRDVPPATI